MNLPNKQYIELLREYLKPQSKRVLILAILLFSSIALQLVNPQVIRYFIDTVQSGGTQTALLLAASLFIVLVLIQRGLVVLTTYFSQTVAWTATNGLRSDLTRHILHLDMSFHNAHTPGELLERIDGDVDRLGNFFSQFILQILSGLLLTIGVLILLVREDWRVGLVMAIFVMLYMVIHIKGQQMAEPQWRLERQYVADLIGFVEERISGRQDIQTSGAISYTMRRFYDVLRRRMWQALKADVVTDVGWTISKIFFDLGTVLTMGLGAWLFQSNAITIGTVYLIIHYLAMINGPLNRIAREVEDLQRVRVSVERVKALTDTQSKIVNSSDAKLPTDRALSVHFDNVTFGYNQQQPVLRNVSFELQPGQILGLLGRTGSGKTTLSRLLFRLYDIDVGHISLNDTDVREADLTALRQQVSMVTQDVQLFQATVRDNLSLFDQGIPDEKIWAGLKTLGLDTWVNGLPDGLDTELAADGTGLSAGEGQLLALVRAFLKEPGLVILDEASSRLDPATEQLLEQAMGTLLQNRTAIIIAHRLATVRRADQILILEEGHIKEYGTYQALATDPQSVFAGLLQTGLEEVLV